MTTGPQPLVLIVGVGAATGQAVCRQLAPQNRLVMVARSTAVIDQLAAQLPDAHAYACDVGDSVRWQALLCQLVEQHGVPDYVLINTEGGGWGAYQDIDLARFADSFPVNVVALLNLVQVLFPQTDNMDKRAHVVINTSPAAYGSEPRFLGLGPARAAQRVLAETLHAVMAPQVQFTMLSIAGAIDEPNMRRAFPDAPDSFFIAPATIAGRIEALFQHPHPKLHDEVSAHDNPGSADQD